MPDSRPICMAFLLSACNPEAPPSPPLLASVCMVQVTLPGSSLMDRCGLGASELMPLDPSVSLGLLGVRDEACALVQEPEGHIGWVDGNLLSTCPSVELPHLLTSEQQRVSAWGSLHLLDNVSGHEILAEALIDPLLMQEHPFEVHGANLYLLRRTGGWGSARNPGWSDLLERRLPDGSWEALASWPGLDFRVSDDERFIGILRDGIVEILDTRGTLLFRAQELAGYRLLGWHTSTLFVGDHPLGAPPTTIVGLDADDDFGVDRRRIGSHQLLDYAFNGKRPAILGFECMNNLGRLIVHDLMERRTSVVAEGSACFQARWMDDDHVVWRDTETGKEKIWRHPD